jgi:hypothetical protein
MHGSHAADNSDYEHDEEDGEEEAEEEGSAHAHGEPPTSLTAEPVGEASGV